MVPLGARPYGVLDVRVSTRRLQDWARLERQRAYFLALISALMVALGVAVLTARWVGQPLAEIGHFRVVADRDQPCLTDGTAAGSIRSADPPGAADTMPTGS